MSPGEPKAVAAAGGIPWRNADGGIEVLLVHRNRYHDWSLPKGKLDPGETHEDAAVREVREETGVKCELGTELRSVTYDLAKGKKRSNGSKVVRKSVRYWSMTPVDPHAPLMPDDPEEITEAAWVDITEAGSKLTHQGDRDVLAELVEQLD